VDKPEQKDDDDGEEEEQEQEDQEEEDQAEDEEKSEENEEKRSTKGATNEGTEGAVDEAHRETEERVRVQEHKEWIRTLRRKRIVLRYVHTQPIYLLFNPWHESTLSSCSSHLWPIVPLLQVVSK